MPAYQFPVYTADPAWCDIIYTYTINDSAGEAAFTFDDVNQKFTFSYSADLLLSGPTSTDYTITVTGTSGNIVPASGFTTFKLTLKNPCIDPTFVTIQKEALPAGEQYILHDFKAAGGYQFTHQPFTIVASAEALALCGDLTYTATFEGSVADGTTKPPMAYDSASRTFTIYSEDFNLLGDRTFTVAASLTQYPTTVTSLPDASETIEIIDPCLDPFSLTATA